MRSLEDYVRQMSLAEETHPIGYAKEDIVEQANVFYQFSGIPDNIYNDIIDNKFPDIVKENLNSHDWKLLSKKLLKEFPKYFEKVYIEGSEKDEKTPFGMLVKDESIIQGVIDDERVKAVLDFFNYFYTQTSRFNKRVMLFEPKYSKKVNDLLKYSTIAYHVTTNNKDNRVRSIKTHGLKPMHGSYREYPDRIYMYIPYDEDPIDAIRFLISMKRIDKEEAYIFKINLDGWHGDLYNDSIVDDGQCVFTYSSIPAKMIEDVTYKCKDEL